MMWLRSIVTAVRRWWGRPDVVGRTIDRRRAEVIGRNPRSAQDMSSRGGGFV